MTKPSELASSGTQWMQRVTSDRSVLIVFDIQNDFCHPPPRSEAKRRKHDRSSTTRVAPKSPDRRVAGSEFRWAKPTTDDCVMPNYRHKAFINNGLEALLKGWVAAYSYPQEARRTSVCLPGHSCGRLLRLLPEYSVQTHDRPLA
jgi:hypothetical protein